MEESGLAENIQMRVELMFPGINSKEFQCPVCAKYFSRKFTLDEHMLIHKGEKPHACPFCGKCFRQKGTLMRHKALHSTRNLFHCSLCDRGFRQKNVFLHHLKHRHNVSTETLDRRKYRTDLQDYQSIMDTLPPFVHADSTAIASSEKHLDAMLFNSFHLNDNSCDRSSTGNNINIVQSDTVLNATDGRSAVHGRCLNSNMNTNVNLHSQEDYQYFETKSNEILNNQLSKQVAGQECFVETKPLINNNFTDIASSDSDRTSGILSVSGPDVFIKNTNNSAACVSSTNVKDENLICLPCQLHFTNEGEFKCHMKTHVQSIIQDVNPIKSNINDVLPDMNVEKANICIKTEVPDGETEQCSLQKEDITEFAMNSPVSNKFECPVCTIYFQTQNALKKHAKKHNSFELLKIISKLHDNKKCQSIDQNSNAPHNVYEICNPNHIQNLNKSTKAKLQRNIINPKKSVTKNKIVDIHSKKLCVKCNKIFSNKFLFEYHCQLHLNVKGFTCNCCKKRFSNKQMLLSHMRLHHMKNFTCTKCFRTFNYRKLFKFHGCTCTNVFTNNSNGGNISFPMVSIETLLNSNVNGMVGIIPVCNSAFPHESDNFKVGIPVMSISHIKMLCASSKNKC